MRHRSFLLPLLLAGLFCSVSAYANVEDGVRKWRAGDYAGAVAEWKKPAEQGNRDAQFNLGQAYKLGRGVPVDTARAIALYRKAAAQGHEAAEANLGWVLFQQGEREEAIPLLQHAATLGDAHSQYLLGIAHFNGDNVERDWGKAYRLMSAAAASGLPQARDALATMDSRIPLAERQAFLATADKTRKPPAAPAAASPPRGVAKKAVTPPPPAPVPQPAAAPPERAATPASAPSEGIWRIQLGAFSDRQKAISAWSTFTARHPSLKGLNTYYEAAANVIRLQAGPFADKKAADSQCEKLAGDGGSCFVVRN